MTREAVTPATRLADLAAEIEARILEALRRAGGVLGRWDLRQQIRLEKHTALFNLVSRDLLRRGLITITRETWTLRRAYDGREQGYELTVYRLKEEAPTG